MSQIMGIYVNLLIMSQFAVLNLTLSNIFHFDSPTQLLNFIQYTGYSRFWYDRIVVVVLLMLISIIYLLFIIIFVILFIIAVGLFLWGLVKFYELWE